MTIPNLSAVGTRVSPSEREELRQKTRADLDAYTTSLRPLKVRFETSSGTCVIRISVGAFRRGRGSEPGVRVAADVVKALPGFAHVAITLAAEIVFAGEHFDPTAVNNLGQRGAYAPIWPTHEEVTAQVARVIAAAKAQTIPKVAADLADA